MIKSIAVELVLPETSKYESRYLFATAISDNLSRP
jgi:hypothetical protein